MTNEPTTQKFRAAWSYHIKQLTTLAIQANVTLEEKDAIANTLNDWVEKAITEQELESEDCRGI